MVQSINTKAIFTLASIVRRPSLIVPHIAVPTISDVNYEDLKEHGMQGVIFDKDNTLTAPYSLEVHRDAKKGLENAINVFGVENIAILSNSAGTNDDPDFEGARKIEIALGIPVIRHEVKKPGGLEEVLEHFGIDDPTTLCMVGDRLLTDIVFGNMYGMLTLHTLPLCKGSENKKDNWTAKILRPIENRILYRSWWLGRWLRRRKLQHSLWSKSDTNSPQR